MCTHRTQFCIRNGGFSAATTRHWEINRETNAEGPGLTVSPLFSEDTDGGGVVGLSARHSATLTCSFFACSQGGTHL